MNRIKNFWGPQLIKVGFLVGASLMINSCGRSNSTTTFSVIYSPDSSNLMSKLINTDPSHVTMRAGVTYDGLVDSNNRQVYAFIPFAAAPQLLTTGSGDSAVTDYEWNSATGAGVPYSGKVLPVNDIPLGKVHTQIIIEFLVPAPSGDDQTRNQRVIGATCITFSGTSALTEADLLTRAANNVVLYPGQSCGKCSDTYKPPTGSASNGVTTDCLTR